MVRDAPSWSAISFRSFTWIDSTLQASLSRKSAVTSPTASPSAPMTVRPLRFSSERRIAAPAPLVRLDGLARLPPIEASAWRRDRGGRTARAQGAHRAPSARRSPGARETGSAGRSAGGLARRRRALRLRREHRLRLEEREGDDELRAAARVG